ncbi:uncharacterized protein LOC120217073 [Hibiscus syriacus]|uniref:uncharacterized protein LOC120217073 n=1 Tax=Hibiscus syriacus TaxID=106335 RepID=UPI00192125F1|nr:uncharacterized protein LOC120217073 [Hibiscus syriacus]
MLSFASLLAPIRILLCEIAILNRSLQPKSKQGIKPKGRDIRRDIRREKMIARSNLADLLREYQIRSKHDWAAVSFFASTSNPTSSRVDVAFVILAFLVLSAVSLYFRHMHLAFILAGIVMLLFLCIKITKQARLANNKKRRMLLPLSM